MGVALDDGPPWYAPRVPAPPALSLTQRWALVSARLGEEARSAGYEHKLVQLAALMASVDDFGWREALGEEDDRVRAIWARLRASVRSDG